MNFSHFNPLIKPDVGWTKSLMLILDFKTDMESNCYHRIQNIMLVIQSMDIVVVFDSFFAEIRTFFHT